MRGEFCGVTMDAFARLGMPYRLVIEETECQARVDERCRAAHPDAGGVAGDFENVRRAGEVLLNPAKRLREAVLVVGGEEGERGAIPGEVMAMFSEVAGVLERVRDFSRERGQATSRLGRAVCEARVPGLKGELEAVMGRVEGLQAGMVGRFGEFDEKGWEESAEAMGEVSRGLRFLERWKGELRAATGVLFEALLGQ